MIKPQKKKFKFLEFAITDKKSNKITGSPHPLIVIACSDSFFRMSWIPTGLPSDEWISVWMPLLHWNSPAGCLATDGVRTIITHRTVARRSLHELFRLAQMQRTILCPVSSSTWVPSYCSSLCRSLLFFVFLPGFDFFTQIIWFDVLQIWFKLELMRPLSPVHFPESDGYPAKFIYKKKLSK